MKLKSKTLFSLIAVAMMNLSLVPMVSAQEVTGVEVDAPIVVSPELAKELTPEELAELNTPSEGPEISPMTWTNCTTYENRAWPIQDRNACFNITGSGLWADSQRVSFHPSRHGGEPYTYVNARFNVDRPNGMYYWGTGGGSVNITNGYARTMPLNTYIEAGNWCLRYQLQRTSGVWENWQ